MKRVSGYLSAHLDAVRMDRHGLEHVKQLLEKVTNTVFYCIDDFEYSSIEELQKNTNGIIRTLEIHSTEPYLSIDFGRRGVWLYTSSSRLDARGVFAEIEDFLKEKALPSSGIRKQALDSVSTFGVIVGSFTLFEGEFSKSAIAWATVPIALLLNIYGSNHSTIEVGARKSGFWIRNRENLVVGFIASALATLAFLLIDLVLNRNG